MIARRTRRVTIFDWIACRDHELRALGVDPSRRLAVTGHRRALPLAWVASIGCWGQFEVRELINEDAPHSAVLHVTAAALRQFKSRWRLMTKLQWQKAHGSHSWSMPSACYEEHERAARVFLDSCGVKVPIGLACEYAVATAAARWRGRSLGLLPIEMLLHVRRFHEFLGHHGLSLADWAELTARERDEVWSRGGAPTLDGLLGRPAIDHFEDRLRELARGA